MTPHESERLMEHEYDGIQEYDNPTPGWWHMILVASIVFSAVYAVYYHFSPLASSAHEKLDAAKVAAFERTFAEFGDMEPDEKTILKMMNEERMLLVAKGKFEGSCASCHLADGSGSTGPNLTDGEFVHIQKLEDIYDVITVGRNAGAMPGWPTIDKNTRIILTAYVATLRGKNLPGKPTEGSAIAPWPEYTPPQEDSPEDG